MTHTKAVDEKEASTTVSNQTEVEVPARLVTTIASRLEASGIDNPAAEDVRDFAHDHVETSTEFVTPDGQSLETAVLARVRSPAVDPVAPALEDEDELIDVPLEEDTLAAVDEAADRAGVDRLEWIRRAAAGRLDTDDVALTFDEDECSSSEPPEPIGIEATAELDYAADPERPLSIELEVPAGVVDDVDLDDALAAVSIEARIAEE